MSKRDPYTAIVDTAAAELERLVRTATFSGHMPTVYAVPTTDDEDGSVVVVMPGQPAPERGVAVMPNANYASVHTSWYSVEYTAMRHILWQALRNQPILPREKPPSGPHVVRVAQHKVGGHSKGTVEVYLNGEKFGALLYDMRSKSYEGDLPQHDGEKRRVCCRSVKAVEAEVVAINREAKAAGRI